MTTTLVSGANKGIGREVARRLLLEGHDVWVGARDVGRGRAAADELGARFVQLDVTDDASVSAAVETISAAGGLDVLVNNAGVNGGPSKPAADTTADDLALVYATNVFGLVRVTHALLPLLERSAAPVVVNVSSGLGSVGLAGDHRRLEFSVPGIDYPSSKAAVNLITYRYAKELPRFRVNCVDPGWTATDLTGDTGTKTVEQGAEVVVRMALVGPDGPTGTFVDEDGPLPW